MVHFNKVPLDAGIFLGIRYDLVNYATRTYFVSDSTSKYRASLHWITFMPSVFFIIVAISMFVGISEIPKLVPLALLALSLGGFFLQFLNLKTAYFDVFSDKVCFRRGILTRNISSVPLRRIESVDVKQSFIGCILNYGSIILTGSGGSHYYMHQISSPLTCRRMIEQELFTQ
jgi:uncharacterized membrane protein YdbT with pleckstrin-like domain